jgi:hypothetical protein
MTRFLVALTTLACVSSALAVIRSPYPVKPSAPVRGVFVVIDELKQPKR